MKFRLLAASGLSALLMTGGTVFAQAERNLFDEAPWYIGGVVGYLELEGDVAVKDSNLIGLRLGHDLHEYFGLELGLDFAPNMEAREQKNPNRFQLEDDTSALRLSLSGLLHLRNTQNLHWDPYLSAGVSLTHFMDDLEDGSTFLGAELGAGLFYHFNDMWAVRGEYRTTVAGEDTEFAGIFTVGVNYRWGAYVPPKYSVSGGEIDSDGDGLLDSAEQRLGTNPFDPDTDKDGLSDGEEVNQYKTDPLNPDTDWDALKDGAEILTYRTDPLDPDTDDGGVTDGHEVIEDNTDPLDPSDDLQLFTLNIEFDYDKAILRSEYFDELDVVVKVLQRDGDATARIEGHADKRPTSKRDYNIKLSERRAKAVLDYLADVGGIDRSRLTSKGYGFDRPIAPNDTEENMQRNRRTEIYIRRSANQEEIDTRDTIEMESVEDGEIK